MPAPLAYLITWTCYGTWLHGDDRGSIQRGKPLLFPPDSWKHAEARARMTGPARKLNPAERQLVERTIRDHSAIRRWTLHAVNVRSNHVHVVVTADREPHAVMTQLKAWTSRRLGEHHAEHSLALRARKDVGGKWWTEGGSVRWINREEHLANAIAYVNEAQ